MSLVHANGTRKVFSLTDTSANLTDYLRTGAADSATESSFVSSTGFEALSDYASSGDKASAAYAEGFLLHSTGFYLLKIASTTTQTFGKKLTEKINGNHTITVNYGNWSLTASNGSISLTCNQGIKLASTNCDMEFECWNGGLYSSDKRDTKESDKDSRTMIYGLEMSTVFLIYTKSATGSAISVNIREISGKLMAVSAIGVKAETFGAMTYSILSGIGVSVKLIGMKFAVIDGKKVLYYKKITPWQIYNTATKCKYSAIHEGKVPYESNAVAASMRKEALKSGFRYFKLDS